MKLKNKLFSVAAAGMLVFSNVSTAVVSANDLTTMSQETQKAIYSSNPGTRAVQTYSTATSSKSTALTNVSNNVVITNNVDKKDTIEIKSGAGLKKGDTVYIYDSSNTKLATAKASKDDAEVKITLSKNIGSSQSTLKISRISLDDNNKKLTESDKQDITAPAEAVSGNVVASNVGVVNNLNKTDVITVTHTTASPGTVISVYKASDSNRAIASAKTNDKGVATIKLKLDDKNGAGQIFVSAKENNKLESAKQAVNFSLAPQTDKVAAAGNITQTNNTKSKDVVTVTGVATGETIKIYDATTNKKIGETKAKSSTATVQVTLPKTGNISVTRTAKDKRESTPETVAVKALTTSATSSVKAKHVINATGADYVLVTGLTEGDVVNVYADNSSTEVIGKGTVSKNETQVYIKLKKNVTGNSVYVTRTVENQTESQRVQTTAIN